VSIDEQSPVSGAKDVLDLMQEASDDFDNRIRERHERGAQKYGPFKFLEANTLEEAMEELLDLANYARYTYIKLALLNQKLDERIGDKELSFNVGGAFTPGRPNLDTEGGN
jgi:DNA-directed RNA polymerase subunit F